jgi:hypothetical protein
MLTAVYLHLRRPILRILQRAKLILRKGMGTKETSISTPNRYRNCNTFPAFRHFRLLSPRSRNPIIQATPHATLWQKQRLLSYPSTHLGCIWRRRPGRLLALCFVGILSHEFEISASGTWLVLGGESELDAIHL